jgi:DNA-binding MarR family transcriptional regulator
MDCDKKIEGKFYPLTPEEFLELNQLLKDAELRVYLYLVTNHPWSDRSVETDTAVIAEHLGLTRRTIQRAIRRLEELELIETEISRLKYCQSRRKVNEKLRATHGSLSNARTLARR